MSVDHTPTDSSGSDPEVMSSVETTDGGPTLVIADVSRDDAWLSVRQSDAPTLREWC